MNLERPWLGPYRKADHELLVPGLAPTGSLALVPLRRREQLDGVLVFSSSDPFRFTPELASDFLAHLGLVAAICVENAVNRARLLRSGLTDFLTGFHNRRYLHARLREELAYAQRSRQSIACLMIDVDHFKRINDQYGHLAGDAVLREVAHRIDAEMRISDTSARFGGDEFAMVLAHAAIDDGEKVAARVLQAVRNRPVPIKQGDHRDRDAVDRRCGCESGAGPARLQGARRAADRGSGCCALSRQERRPQSHRDLAERGRLAVALVMGSLIAASAFFLFIHFGVSGTRLRDALVARLGAGPYRGLFSLVSIPASSGWSMRMSTQRRSRRGVSCWRCGRLVLVVVFVAVLFVAIGLASPSPTSVGMEGKLAQGAAAMHGITRITRHPFLWGVALWALAHLIVNGDLASLILFGTLLLLALFGAVSIDAKRRRLFGEQWRQFAQATSNVPFAAIAAGRNQLAPALWRSAGAAAVAIAIYVWLFWLHGRLIAPLTDTRAAPRWTGAGRKQPLPPAPLAAATAQQHHEQRRTDQRHDRPHRQLARVRRSCAPPGPPR